MWDEINIMYVLTINGMQEQLSNHSADMNDVLEFHIRPRISVFMQIVKLGPNLRIFPP